jgi:hypothetical protein
VIFHQYDPFRKRNIKTCESFWAMFCGAPKVDKHGAYHMNEEWLDVPKNSTTILKKWKRVRQNIVPCFFSML